MLKMAICFRHDNDEPRDTKAVSDRFAGWDVLSLSSYSPAADDPSDARIIWEEEGSTRMIFDGEFR